MLEAAASPVAGMFMSELLRRIAENRDELAFGELFHTYAPKVKAMLLRQGADMATAEEVAQETLLTVWRKAHLFAEGRGSVATWVYTIARNLRIDRIRREVVWQELGDRELEHASDDPSPEQELGERQQASRLTGLVAELPFEQREVLELAFTGGLSQTEIAERLDVPLGTVKSRMRLAYQKLRAAYGEDQ
jgi:RNA polymerase sigma-70 factor (ECF subfamily)